MVACTDCNQEPRERMAELVRSLGIPRCRYRDVADNFVELLTQPDDIKQSD